MFDLRHRLFHALTALLASTLVATALVGLSAGAAQNLRLFGEESLDLDLTSSASLPATGPRFR